MNAYPLKSETASDVALSSYCARNLMKGGDEAHIVLDGQTYTLRITRAGKLILTK